MLFDTLTDIYVFFLDNLKVMITTNLLVACVARAVFVFFFSLDYITIVRGKDTPLAVKELRKMGVADWAWFFTKEALLIGVGFMHMVFAIAIAGYSLMLAGSHVVACAKRSKFKINLVFAWIIAILAKYAVPVLGILAAIVMIYLDTDPSAWNILGGAALAIAAFSTRSVAALVLRQRGSRELSMETALQAAKRRIAGKIPRIFKVVLIACIFTFPVGFYFYLDANAGIQYWTETITTPDGIQLSTDVYRLKSATGPQPVLLVRHPYDKGDMVSRGKEVYPFLLQGFTVVYQDQRGRYDSSGKFIPFIDDYKDGALTVSWIKNQPWCNGKIASFGGSAGAINQYFYADEPTGALKFQTLLVGSPEYYDYMIFQGGAFRKGMIESWLYMISESNKPKRPTEYSDAIAWYFGHPLKDNAWNGTSLSLNNRYANVKVSALHVGGWYDIFSQGTLDGFVGYNYNGAASALGKQRLVMGPIGHGKFGELSAAFNHASTLRFPDADASRHANWEAEMRNAAIFGGDINWSGPRVAYYLMGDVNDPSSTANKWYYANDWPVPHSDTTYYLHGNRSLATVVPGTNQTISYVYDPDDPVPTRGGNNLISTVASLEPDALGLPQGGRVLQYEGIGPYDQQAAGNLGRSDVIVFQSPVLTAPVSVVGRVMVNLWIASNCSDTAFTAMLMDQFPNGSCYNVLDGIAVTRYREGYDHVASDLQDGRYYKISIDLWSTAWQFNTGHRIKIAISSSNYPRFERHPNNSLPLTNHPGSFNVARNTILCGTGMYNASIVLPTVVL
ncbi:MAG: CocE/NonD family hydrolase [Candidatus Sigynarchaeota archaeon]